MQALAPDRKSSSSKSRLLDNGSIGFLPILLGYKGNRSTVDGIWLSSKLVVEVRRNFTLRYGRERTFL